MSVTWFEGSFHLRDPFHLEERGSACSSRLHYCMREILLAKVSSPPHTVKNAMEEECLRERLYPQLHTIVLLIIKEIIVFLKLHVCK